MVQLFLEESLWLLQELGSSDNVGVDVIGFCAVYFFLTVYIFIF